MPQVSEQRDIDEVAAQAASTMEVLARALHVRDAQLQPTLTRSSRRPPAR
jgi:hypothetical protein